MDSMSSGVKVLKPTEVLDRSSYLRFSIWSRAAWLTARSSCSSET